MAKWFEARGRKESRSCETCKEYKMGGQFYDWYGHPAFPFKDNKLVICTNCTKRETGRKGFIKLKERGVL
jgi:hypothetical protein|tara:strand:+ start:4709 stop:4918 length:210 start_codon:yes stop_codon:yes gene_type:complete